MSNEERLIYDRKNVSLAFQSKICKQVVQYATSNGMKQADVRRVLNARGFKMDQSTFSQLHLGIYTRQISVYTLAAICEAVGLSIFDFIEIKQPGKKLVEGSK